MPFNGAGLYAPPSADFPAVATTLIESAKFNDIINDIATALSTAILKDGTQTVTTNIPFSGNRLTGVGAGVALTDAANLGQVGTSAGVYVAIVGGTANVITITPAPALTAYTTGQRIVFVPPSTNTGATTINPNTLGAKNVFLDGYALKGGEFRAGFPVELEYDGTQFQILSNTAVTRRNVFASSFGAAGDGTTDDTAALQAAIDSLGATGGSVWLDQDKKYLIDNNLTVKKSVFLRGQFTLVGTPGTNTTFDYSTLGSSLRINSTKTVTINAGAGVQGCLAYRKAMTFPAADSSAFAGTAFTAGGDDFAVRDCMILGFDKAIASNGFQRPALDWLAIDCQTGIDLQACTDSPRISYVRGWPYATITNPAVAANNRRTGSFMYFHGQCDGLQVNSAFSFGYLYGLRLNTVDGGIFSGCFFDSDGAHGSSRGINIETNVIRCEFVSPKVISYEQGIVQVGSAGSRNLFVAPSVYGTTSHGININAGDADITSPALHTIGGDGILINVGADVSVGGTVSATGITGVVINTAGVKNDVVRISGPIYSNKAAGTSMVGSYTAQTIASASVINLPAQTNHPGVDVYHISGTTNIDTVNGGFCGRQVKFIFDGALTVNDGSNLQLAGNFNTTAQDSLRVTGDGTNFNEDGRSVN